MDFFEDHCGIIAIITIIIIAVLVIAMNVECAKNGGVIVGGGKSPAYCVKKDAVISD